MRILLLESSPSTARTLAIRLRSEGYAVDVARTLAQAWVLDRDVDYDGLILDREVADGDGLDMVADLRREGVAVPALMMSHRATSDDRVHALQVGVDGYMAKPVNVDELVLRVRKMLIRAPAVSPRRVAPLEVIGRITLSRALKEVYLDGEPVKLTTTQYCLVEYLLTNRHREVTAREMLDHCWDRILPSISNPLPPQITRVRGAFGGALVIESVRPLTYRVHVDGEEGDDGEDGEDGGGGDEEGGGG